MKNLLLIIAIFFSAISSYSQVSVRGYYKSNGTYVQPHQRTAPNSTINDNYSTVGNTNPYTGKAGTVARSGSSNYTSSYSSYKAPTYTRSSYPRYNYSSTNSPRRNYSTSTYSTPTYSTPTYSTPKYVPVAYESASYSTSTPALDQYIAAKKYDAYIYSTPSYHIPSYSTSSTYNASSNTVYTGPRGGTYYINSNGNKSYVSK